MVTVMTKLLSISLLLACSCGCASVATNEKAAPQVKSFALNEVQLLDSPFQQAMERNADYLLSLEPDRFLHNTRQYCGLEPKGELYGGWEARGIAGHSLGHYLTALSLQFAATSDERFREQIDYTIAEMAECQERYGDGYIGALPPKELETMRAFEQGVVEPISGFNFKGGAWVPWYTQHKVLAGLVDAWTLGGNEQAKAVALGLADWVDRITRNLSPDQQQRMLRVEFGGMNEVLVQIYALTGGEHYLEASRRFYHRVVLDPLLAGEDSLNGLHANTQIPKVVGEARAYEVTGNEDGRKIAEFFWNRVVQNRSWVIGGNSDREHFFPVGRAHEHLAPEAAESCNTYNMLRLTKHLFTWDPKPEYADYYERALYNHILASQEPEQGMFAYFMSLKPGLFKTYSTPFDSFWCCVGSGMENHTKYSGAIYFHDEDRLFVNLFIPSILDWKAQGLVLEQRTDYPEKETTEFLVKEAPRNEITLLVRCPSWVAAAPVFELNGTVQPVDAQPGDYAQIRRVWKSGDRLRVTLPMGLWTAPLENDPTRVALLYGPLVLAGDLGEVPNTKSFPYARDQWDNFRAATADTPVLVCEQGESLVDSVERISDGGIAFRTKKTSTGNELILRPFKDLFYEYYNVYWNVLTPDEWTERAEALRHAEERQRLEEARIVDVLHPGEQQSEIDHGIESERSETGDAQDRKWRHALPGGHFQFQMKLLRNAPQVLSVTYFGSDAGREFDILVDGKHLATQTLENSKPGEFFDMEYPIPAEMIADRDKVTIRFESRADKIAGGVYRCAILKASPKPNE